MRPGGALRRIWADNCVLALAIERRKDLQDASDVTASQAGSSDYGHNLFQPALSLSAIESSAACPRLPR